MPKVIGILGSPRKNGNTDVLLDKFLEAAAEAGAETEKIWLRRLKFQPCLEIYACQRTGDCILKDDMTPLYDKLIDSDIIVIASPIFFRAVTSDTKAFLDRCQSFWARKHVLKWAAPPSPSGEKRVGVFISACGSAFPGMFQGAIDSVNSVFETLDMEDAHTLTFNSIDEKGDILEHEDLIEKTRSLAREIVLGSNR